MSIEFRKLIKVSGVLLVVSVFAWGAMTSQVCGAESKWDKALLNMDFRNVSIKAVGISAAWREITTRYLLRANIYMDAQTDSGSKAFIFKKENTTGKEILEALLVAYPAYTYTQDRESGVIWIHPKQTKYQDILNEKIKVAHPVYQIRMFTGIYEPLCRLLSSDVIAASLPYSGSPSSAYCYFVDLPSGVFSARDILNCCSTANPTKAFAVGVGSDSLEPIGLESFKPGNKRPIFICDLHYLNPFALPRAAALNFWEIGIGKSESGIPSVNEVNATLCDTNFIKRWAATAYLEAAQANYSPVKLIEKTDDPEKMVWVALAFENTLYRGIGDPDYFENVATLISGFMNNMMLIKDPRLALVTSLELAREKQGTNYIYLDSIVSRHKFTQTEIDSIKPDVYRLAHESPLALDKLRALKLDVPEFAPKALEELADTNFLTLAPADQK